MNMPIPFVQKDDPRYIELKSALDVGDLHVINPLITLFYFKCKIFEQYEWVLDLIYGYSVLWDPIIHYFIKED